MEFKFTRRTLTKLLRQCEETMQEQLEKEKDYDSVGTVELEMLTLWNYNNRYDCNYRQEVEDPNGALNNARYIINLSIKCDEEYVEWCERNELGNAHIDEDICLCYYTIVINTDGTMCLVEWLGRCGAVRVIRHEEATVEKLKEWTLEMLENIDGF